MISNLSSNRREKKKNQINHDRSLITREQTAVTKSSAEEFTLYHVYVKQNKRQQD